MFNNEQDATPMDPGIKWSHDAQWKGTVPTHLRACTNAGFIPVFFICMIACLAAGIIIRANNGLLNPFDFESGDSGTVPSPDSAVPAPIPAVPSEPMSLASPTQWAIGAIVFVSTISLTAIWLVAVRTITPVVVYGSIVGWALLTIAGVIISLIAGNILSAIFSGLLFVVVAAWLFFSRHQIPLAIVFLREGAVSIFENLVLVLFVVPVLTIIATVAYTSLLYSWTAVLQMPSNIVISVFAVFGIFCSFWMHETLVSIKTVAIAHCVASWYVMRRTRGGERASAFTGLVLASTKHLGSVLYGAMIIAIIATLRTLAEHGRRRTGGGGSAFDLALQLIACCIICILACLEELVRYVNRYAMIYVAIHGEDFCSSTKRVMQLFFRGDCQVFINDIVVSMVIRVCSLLMILISLGVGLGVTYAFHGSLWGFLSIPPIGAILLGSAVIFLFADTLTTAVDTIFVSYMEDIERNVQIGQPINCSPEWQGAIASYDAAPPNLKSVPMPPPIGVSDGSYQAAQGGPGYPGGPVYGGAAPNFSQYT